MSSPFLFDTMPPERARLAEALRRLAGERIYLGTSSWKYEGWMGQVYTRERYMARGRFSQRLFEDTCIAEYGEVFPIVCGDFSFYQFPSESYWRRLFTTASAGLHFAFKVPEQITVKVYPGHARYGANAGQSNPAFLDADLLKNAFLAPLAAYRERVPVLIFEFGSFSKTAYPGVGEFVADLDRFLARLPGDFRYSVEIRNPEYLRKEYFDCLRAHNVAHTFTAWSRMPELGDQASIPGAFTAGFLVCRALLRRGRSYEQAVEKFAPYDRIQEPNPRAREALRGLIRRARESGQPAYIFVNNRLEGNAPATIQAVVEE